MDKFIVVTINNSQARFFTLEEAEWPEYESGPSLLEQANLLNSTPHREQKFWLKITKKYQQKSQQNKFNQAKFDRRFAQKITSQIVNLIRIYQGQKIILIAQPQILSIIRKLLTPTIFNNIKIREIPKDISHFSSNQIHQYLAHKQLIPAYQKVFYPR